MLLSNTVENLLSERNAILQASLREGFDRFPIVKEYPLVLASDRLQHSFCLLDPTLPSSQNLLAHANYLPRKLVRDSASENREEVTVALIGNVCSPKLHRNKGYVRELLHHLSEKASAEEHRALILWGDLQSFYHKLGFVPWGNETRYFLQAENLPRLDQGYRICTDVSPLLGSDTCSSLLKLRYPALVTLARSVEEFQSLLQIPETYLVRVFDNNALIGFCILGKGYDMVGVIHEWGANTPSTLLGCIKHILLTTASPELLLLAPYELNLLWQKAFDSTCSKKENHPLALMKQLSPLPDWTQSTFIWGLDSI